MELKDTIEMMNSPNYKERFKAELHQLKIRIDKLEKMLDAWRKGQLGFTPSCPHGMLETQLHVMKAYHQILIDRAIIENIFVEEDG